MAIDILICTPAIIFDDKVSGISYSDMVRYFFDVENIVWLCFCRILLTSRNRTMCRYLNVNLLSVHCITTSITCGINDSQL